MDRGTVRTSAILVSTGKGTRLYSNLEKLPETVRRKLRSVAAGSEFATLVIADRRGVRELLEGRCEGLRTTCEPAARRRTAGLKGAARFLAAHWLEAALSGTLGVILWLMLRVR
jgi:hypothetical protein